MRRRWTRAVVKIGLMALAFYVVTWGVSWLSGETTSAHLERDVGYPRVRYPGVAFGGLPPAPAVGDEVFQIGAITLGLAILTLVVFSEVGARRRRRTGHVGDRQAPRRRTRAAGEGA